MNIRAFKIIFPKGETAFESKNRDDRNSDGCTSIQALAEIVKSEVTCHLQENEFSQVSIDLAPFHDIEHPSDLTPRFCKALSEEEKREFWKYYNS